MVMYVFKWRSSLVNSQSEVWEQLQESITKTGIFVKDMAEAIKKMR